MAPLDPYHLGNFPSVCQSNTSLAQCLPPYQKPPFLVPIVFGTYSSQLMLGILCVQADCYRRRYMKRDSWWIKGPVLGLVVLNVCLFGLDLSRKVKMFGLGFGDLIALGAYHKRREDLAAQIFSVIISAIAQIFLIGRSFVFSQAIDGPYRHARRLTFAIAKTVIALLAFSAGLAMTYEFNKFENFFQFSAVNKFYLLGTARYPLLKILWLGLNMVTDLLICCSLSLDLQRAKTGNKNSNSFLSTMIFNSLRNGFLIFILQSLALLLYFFSSASWTDLGSLCLPRLLTITVLSSITSPRDTARSKSEAAARVAAARDGGARGAGRIKRVASLRRYHSAQGPPLPVSTPKNLLNVQPSTPTTESEKSPSQLQSPPMEPSKSSSLTSGSTAYTSTGGGSPRSKKHGGASFISLASLSSGRRNNEWRPGSSGSGAGGGQVSVETSSWVEVQEGVEVGEQRLGNHITIQGPPSLSYLPGPSRSPRPRTLSSGRRFRPRTSSSATSAPSKPELDQEFIDSLPSGQVSSISTGTYDPEADVEGGGFASLGEFGVLGGGVRTSGETETVPEEVEVELRDGEDVETARPAGREEELEADLEVGLREGRS